MPYLRGYGYPGCKLGTVMSLLVEGEASDNNTQAGGNNQNHLDKGEPPHPLAEFHDLLHRLKLY